MNIVWPVTALYFSVFAVWAYFTFGQSNSHSRPAQVAVGTSHCGAGCTLADVMTEFAVAASGLMLFGSRLFTSFAADFVAAWAFGIVLQYFAIKPMKPRMTRGEAIVAAIKADTLSIVAFQVGMYAIMAVSHHFLRFNAFDPRYWFVMQGAMIAGFATAYPMNAWLIHHGMKEAM